MSAYFVLELYTPTTNEELIWKTDWTAADNYARSGSVDIDRLIGNYDILATNYQRVFGIDVDLETLQTNGYRTLPFADFLNTVERNLQRLYAFPITDWIKKDVHWQPTAKSPDYTDINRWEFNGRLVDRMIINTQNWMVSCGVPAVGQSRLWQQRFRRR